MIGNNIKQIAHKKNISIYRLIKRGLITALKLRSLKIRNSEINRFLIENDGKDLTDLDNIKELTQD